MKSKKGSKKGSKIFCKQQKKQKMGLKPGMTNNPTGRPKGGANKVSKELRESITNFLELNFTTLKSDFKKLSPKERVKSYTDLLQFAVPKLQSTSLDIDFERLDDDQLDEIIDRLKQAPNEAE